jgi:oxygen-dependent protoporphyrinogen oxidase
VRRWPRAVAQPKPGHTAGLRDARARLAACGPIALAGGYTDGVSVADSFASGIAAAAQLERMAGS